MPVLRRIARVAVTLIPVIAALVQWARDRKIDIELLHADRSPGQSTFDAVLADLAAHTDRATARTTAKYMEYPSGHLDLAGAGWPRRPTGLLALALLLAVGVGLLPHMVRPAIRRVRRRRAAQLG
jgi:hypothetical protein